MAITLTPSDLQTRFPEFGALGDARIQPWIDQAISRINEAQWSAKATEGATMLAAHLVAYFEDAGGAGEGAAAGAVQSEREGGVAVSYAISDHLKDKGELASTKYGRNYLTLLRGIFVTRCV